MKNLILCAFLFLLTKFTLHAQATILPDSIYSGKQGSFHVQGAAVDRANGFVYFSFTDRLVKTDLSGKMIGSVTGFVGHLGDLAISEDGTVYASLEYKSDAIGKGIKKELGLAANNQDGFYIAIFEASKITKPDMQADNENLLTTVFIKEAVKDYSATVKFGKAERPHRFACSGIDGIAFAPAAGAPPASNKYLYVAYGIYGDLDRNDNDYQVILKYDIANWKNYAKRLTQANLHRSGPKKPLEKYFVKTGSTRYGIQNLEYDTFTGNLFAAVYKGSKPEFPNYDLFVIDLKKTPLSNKISVGEEVIKVKTLSLLNADTNKKLSEIAGWHFKWGATGLVSLGDGRFYISHNGKTKDGQQQTTLYKYRWTAENRNPFVLIAEKK
ncbi:hypothetical protein [Pedobacter endophyticus]|uniref:Uncharacterized protein n=1 Tax=Pedobacter endophyticus TaxID=2789740 RepID=A0A7S9L1F0_9SPHI|nr:hypothetical protein [Pedobacter endophyticus]QPH40740.1 hypothetical protein IZT61_05580 [Pedobacter endophyticus]